jgi:hypothetical protein
MFSTTRSPLSPDCHTWVGHARELSLRVWKVVGYQPIVIAEGPISMRKAKAVWKRVEKGEEPEPGLGVHRKQHIASGVNIPLCTLPTNPVLCEIYIDPQSGCTRQILPSDLHVCQRRSQCIALVQCVPLRVSCGAVRCSQAVEP